MNKAIIERIKELLEDEPHLVEPLWYDMAEPEGSYYLKGYKDDERAYIEHLEEWIEEAREIFEKISGARNVEV